MAEPWRSLEHIEWQLIRGVPVPEVLDDSLQGKVLSGRYDQVLRSATSHKLAAQVAKHVQCLHTTATPDVFSTLALDVNMSDTASALDTLCVAVAALQAFVQLNWTGPDFLLAPAALLHMCGAQYFPQRVPNDEDAYMAFSKSLNAACLESLTQAGEPAYHLAKGPFYLVYARQILGALERNDKGGHLQTLPWWDLRVGGVHRRLLDDAVEPNAQTLEKMQAIIEQCKQRAAIEPDVANGWGTMAARAILEVAIAHQRAGNDRKASELLMEAAKTNALVYEMTGAPGKRTKFQKDDKMQLVLLAESRHVEEDRPGDAVQRTDSVDNSATVNPAAQVDHQPANLSLNDDTLLEQTMFTSTAADKSSQVLAHIDPANQPALAVTDQCILLALCLNIQNTQPSHGLTTEQMSVFVERILSHPRNWSVHTMALLLRSRLEAHRSRTVDRSALQLQALIDQMPSNDSSLRERMRFFYSLELPPQWEMQAELARRYVSIGVLRSALEIFERIEMWDEVVQCLGLLGRKEEAVEVVRDLLQGHKTEAEALLAQKRNDTRKQVQFARAREAKLWCLLGDLDVAHAEDHYQKAWDISNATSGRAARSLGAYHFALSAFDKAAAWLRRAVRINALFTRSWFMMGCSYMRMQQWVEAASAFRKCTALEEEDGESWNNLANCYLQMHQSQMDRLDKVFDAADDDAASMHSTSTAADSGVGLDADDEETGKRSTNAAFELRVLAHKALGVALKYNFDSWRVWYNYMIVSINVGMMHESARALARIVEIRSKEASQSSATTSSVEDVVDFTVLNRIVDAVIQTPWDEDDPLMRSQNEGHGLRADVQRLFENTLLPRFSTNAAILQVYARFLLWAHEYRKMLDVRIKSFRFGLGAPDATQVVTDLHTFCLAKDELQDLVDALENTGTRPAAPGSTEEAMPDWNFQARTLLRAFIARTRDSFADEPHFASLAETLQGLRTSV
ncbi:hypothetical protein MVES1_000278 [Malassezia vespertilionis]|uniref:Uncharacterized protein n=1 Tax=Malassezia vespertilionis TaxID=2020962 RepID=A0A2N1JGB8_9BASI|nr:uncharacterized protein MVES1_000278 [Malassezia vespertilionis]PKI85597.1 hypothetical protein MVES_000263 [Malassezia vespertilionis]WFD04953.1 hypothetical protein MVES1_000278 [Malassezia vespertilionis]